MKIFCKLQTRVAGTKHQFESFANIHLENHNIKDNYDSDQMLHYMPPILYYQGMHFHSYWCENGKMIYRETEPLTVQPDWLVTE